MADLQAVCRTALATEGVLKTWEASVTVMFYSPFWKSAISFTIDRIARGYTGLRTSQPGSCEVCGFSLHESAWKQCLGVEAV